MRRCHESQVILLGDGGVFVEERESLEVQAAEDGVQPGAWVDVGVD